MNNKIEADEVVILISKSILKLTEHLFKMRTFSPSYTTYSQNPLTKLDPQSLGQYANWYFKFVGGNV